MNIGADHLSQVGDSVDIDVIVHQTAEQIILCYIATTLWPSSTYTHTYTCIYMCVCVCVCVYMCTEEEGSGTSNLLECSHLELRRIKPSEVPFKHL